MLAQAVALHQPERLGICKVCAPMATI
jgi:hypothetical protein